MIAARDAKLKVNKQILDYVEASISKTINEGRMKLTGVDPFKLVKRDKSPIS